MIGRDLIIKTSRANKTNTGNAYPLQSMQLAYFLLAFFLRHGSVKVLAFIEVVQISCPFYDTIEFPIRFIDRIIIPISELLFSELLFRIMIL